MLLRATRLLCALALLLLAGCAGAPDEAALRQRIDELQAAGEAGEVARLIDAVAEDFAGQGGEYDRNQLRLLLIATSRRHQRIGVTRLGTELEMRGAHASARLTLLLTGASDGLLPNDGRVMNLDTRWRVDGGDWMLIEAQWR